MTCLAGKRIGSHPTNDHLASVLLTATTCWIALTPALSGFGSRIADFVPLATFARGGFLLVVSLLLVHIGRSPTLQHPLTGVEKAMAVYLAVISASWVSTLQEKDVVVLKQDADFLLTCFIMPLTAYWVARTTSWTPARIAGCLWGLAAVLGTHMILLGIIQGTYDWSFFVDEGVRTVHHDRAKGPFPNAVLFGMVLSVLLPVSSFLYLQARGRLGRVAALLLAAGLTQAIVFSKARAVWIGVAAGMLFVAVKCPRLRWPVTAMVAALLLQIAIGVVGPAVRQSTVPAEDDMRARVTEVDSIRNRVAIWATAINMVAGRPLWGHGFGLSTFKNKRADYYASCCGVPVRYGADCVVPHNEMLNVLVLTGVLGLGVYLALVWRTWHLLACGACRDGGADSVRVSLAVCLQAVFVMLALAGQVHDLMYLSYVQLLFWFLVGIVAGREGLASPLPLAPQR